MYKRQEYGMPLDGTELADYEEVIREELKRYGEDDLMQYFEDVYKRQDMTKARMSV